MKSQCPVGYWIPCYPGHPLPRTRFSTEHLSIRPEPNPQQILRRTFVHPEPQFERTSTKIMVIVSVNIYIQVLILK